MSWIRIKNRLDTALFDFNFQNDFVNSDRYMLSLLNLYEKIRFIVRFEMNSSNNFVECQSILSAPISNNKRLDKSYRPCYQPIDSIMISFVIIYIPVLIWFANNMDRLLCLIYCDQFEKMILLIWFGFEVILWIAEATICDFNWLWIDFITVGYPIWFRLPDFATTNET